MSNPRTLNFEALDFKALLRRNASGTLETRITIYRELETLEPVWRAIEGFGHASVFQSWAVFHAWATHIAPSEFATWFVIAVEDQTSARPLLLLPLSVKREGALKIIEGADLGVSDYFAPVIAAGFQPSESEMRRLWDDVRDAIPAGDILRLSKMPAMIGGVRNPLLDLHNVNGMRLSAAGVALDSNWQQWASDHIESKLLADMAARTRKLSKRGTVTFEVASEPQRALELFEHMSTQRAERHVAMARPNILARTSFAAFYKSLLSGGETGSPAIMAALSIDGEVIATGYGLVHDRRLHMIFPTFKGDRWRNYSPGMQLFLKTMEWAATNGMTYFDFTIGSEQFKFDLGAREMPLYEKLVALSPRGLRHAMLERLKRITRRHLARRTSKPTVARNAGGTAHG